MHGLRTSEGKLHGQSYYKPRNFRCRSRGCQSLWIRLIGPIVYIGPISPIHNFPRDFPQRVSLVARNISCTFSPNRRGRGRCGPLSPFVAGLPSLPSYSLRGRAAWPLVGTGRLLAVERDLFVAS